MGPDRPQTRGQVILDFIVIVIATLACGFSLISLGGPGGGDALVVGVNGLMLVIAATSGICALLDAREPSKSARLVRNVTVLAIPLLAPLSLATQIACCLD